LLAAAVADVGGDQKRVALGRRYPPAPGVPIVTLSPGFSRSPAIFEPR
jgi:hypothetical protein